MNLFLPFFFFCNVHKGGVFPPFEHVTDYILACFTLGRQFLQNQRRQMEPMFELYPCPWDLYVYVCESFFF